MSIALLGKLIWKIVSDKGSLWREVLNHRYLDQGMGLNFIAGKDASYVRQSISGAWQELQEGFRW